MPNPSLLTQALVAQRVRPRRGRLRLLWAIVWLGGIGAGWVLAAWIGW